MEERLRVLWLGGTPGSGKSTISRTLARRWPLRVYDFNVHEPSHQPLVGEPVWFGLDAAGRPTRLMMGTEVFERTG